MAEGSIELCPHGAPACIVCARERLRAGVAAHSPRFRNGFQIQSPEKARKETEQRFAEHLADHDEAVRTRAEANRRFNHGGGQ